MLSSPDFLRESALSYDFTSYFHTFTLTSIGLILFLSSRKIRFIFFVLLQQNLLQFWVICSFICFTHQPIPNLVSMSLMTAFWRCKGIFENGRCRFSLKCWRKYSFSLHMKNFLASMILIFSKTTSYSTLVLYVPMQDA